MTRELEDEELHELIDGIIKSDGHIENNKVIDEVTRKVEVIANPLNNVKITLNGNDTTYHWLNEPYFDKGASIVNISSSRDRMSQPESETYTASKGGIASLTHALAVSLSNKVRVNSISPGWIDTDYKVYEGPDAIQQPVGRVGNPDDIANMVLYFCSDMASFITGENICIDGGMTKQMIYHDDFGWSLKK